jgi:hypothetical protein
MVRFRLRSKAWIGSSLAAALAAGAVFLSASPVVAAATTWYVATTGNDASSCMSPFTPCMTIQAAINKAAAGDTISVAAGGYPELLPVPHVLGVNKTLTILGAQSGVDARSRVGAESIVSDSQGIYITANNVVIDGFTVQNSVNPAFTGYGIDIGVLTTGAQILNNIIQNNIAGIGLANTGASQVLIRHNQIQNNNVNPCCGASGSGIYTDQYVGGAVTNVLIVENTFKGNADSGIDVSSTDATKPVSNIDISTNLFDQNGRATVLFNTHNSTIHNNTISNNTLTASAAIRLFDNNSGLTIMNNNLINGVGHAIRFSFLSLVGGPSSNVAINKNNIGATPISFPLSGLTVDAAPAAYVGTVNATCNWWGSPSGPMNPGNPGGTGEKVVGNANFTPWWTMASQTSPCPPPVCKPGDEDNGDGDVQDQNGQNRGHFHFDECDSNQEFSHRDSKNNVDFHSSPGDHSSPRFDASLPVVTTTGHGLNNGKNVTYFLVATAGIAPGTGLYFLTLSDASGVIYTSSGKLSFGYIKVRH